MHADTDTGADVTARALARVEAARARAKEAKREPSYAVVLACDKFGGGWEDLDKRDRREVLAADPYATDVPLLAAIAAAAVRLAHSPRGPDDPPWWGYWWYRDSASAFASPACIACRGATPVGGDWDAVDHSATCPALALDAAIRAAGEAG